MLSILRMTIAPLTSLFLFTLGNGFFLTLLAYHMTRQGESSLLTGAMTGFFYMGLVIGAYRIEPIISRIGHIRAYAAFASAFSVVYILHGMIYWMPLWILLRFIGGIATAGIFIVIESWLLCQAPANLRGQVLSFYMISLYSAQALGQFFLNLGSTNTLLLFATISMLCSLSVIPLAITNIPMPIFAEPSSLKLRALYKSSASGLVGCLGAGLILGAVYGLSPVFFTHLFSNRGDVSLLMFTTIVGGMLLQYPFGKLSDYIERRLVIIIVVAFTALFAAFTLQVVGNYWLLLICTLFFGGFAFAIYPVSVSYACDSLEYHNIVAGTQALLLVYSVGAMSGPLLAPLFIHYMGSNGLYVYFSVICLAMLPFLIWRKTYVADVPHEESFVNVVQTTPIIAELDPRGEAEEANSNNVH